VNKQLKVLKENTNKHMNKIKKTMQDMKEETNKDVETLTTQPEINKYIFQLKLSAGSFTNRRKQFENTVSGTEDKVE
jgi:hypothetical protein